MLLAGTLTILMIAPGATGAIREIKLDRGGSGWVIRPTYEVTLRADGTVIYTGHLWCKHTGPWKARIKLARFTKLTHLIKELQFERLNTLKSDRSTPTDTFRMTVTVSNGSRVKSSV